LTFSFQRNCAIVTKDPDLLKTTVEPDG